MQFPSPPAESSPLRAGVARAGRRSTAFAPLPPSKDEQPQQQVVTAGDVLSPPRTVTFAEPTEGASLRSSVTGGPKRVGFDLPPGGDGNGGGAAAAEEGGGWEDGGTRVFAGVSRRKQEHLQREQSDGTRQRSKYDEREIDRVDEIPDLTTVAAAGDPGAARTAGARHARVQPLSELQRDQAWVPAGGGGAGGIDLSLLTACLCPSEQVQDEGDDVWDADQLLAALKSELGADNGAAGNGGGQQDDLVGI